MIISIVDRPRFGLLEHSQALCYYGSFSGISISSIVHPSLPKEPHERFYSAQSVLRVKNSTVVVWSFGPTIFLLPWLRLRGNRIVLVVHEPGGFRQRLRKGDGIFYALGVSLVEKIFGCFSSIQVTPNKRNANALYSFAPLLFKQVACERANDHHGSPIFLYLGRKDSRRCYDEFLELSYKEPEKYTFFPTEKSSSEADKRKAILRARCVFNVYRVKHNQSGVTPDALCRGTPVIVGNNDAWAVDIASRQLGLVVDVDTIKSVADIEGLLNKFVKDDEMSCRCYGYSDEEFGFTAFEKYWKRLLLT